MMWHTVPCSLNKKKDECTTCGRLSFFYVLSFLALFAIILHLKYTNWQPQVEIQTYALWLSQMTGCDGQRMHAPPSPQPSIFTGACSCGPAKRWLSLSLTMSCVIRSAFLDGASNSAVSSEVQLVTCYHMPSDHGRLRGTVGLWLILCAWRTPDSSPWPPFTFHPKIRC